MNKTHYTYRIEDIETGEYYIGSRSCVGKAEDDDYMGSMRVWKPNKENLKKIILNDKFSNREEAIAEEVKMIKENIENELNQNYNIPGLGFHNTGRIFGSETRNRMRVARLGENNPNFGKKHSEETKNKIRKKALGRKLSEEVRKRFSDIRPKKAVLQFDKQMNFIKEYKSIREAGNTTNTDKGDISKVCSNKQKSAGGFIWKLK